MKRYNYNVLKYAWLLLSVLCLFTACENDPESTPALSMKDMQIDSTSVLLADGDALGLFLVEKKTGTEDLMGPRFCDNVKVVKRGGSLVPETAITPYAGRTFDVIGYSPYVAEPVAAGSAFFKFDLTTDQTALADYRKNDFVYSREQNMVVNNEVVNLEFKHMMSKVNIMLDLETAYSAEELATLKIELVAVASSVEIDLNSGEIGMPVNRRVVTPNGAPRVENNVVKGFSAILIPQLFKKGSGFLKITIGNQDRTYPLAEDFRVLGGKSQNVRFRIGKEVKFEMIVSDWVAGGEVSDDVFPGASDLGVLTDLEGNEYPIIKIGDQYWTASNLKVTKFNDGTPIVKAKENNDWFNSKNGAYCFYNNDDTRKEKFGALYNNYAVKTGKLCPKGWHIPTREEWLAARTTLGGEYFAGIAMKTTSGWRSKDDKELAQYQGTNSSGFTAIPGSYRDWTGKFDHTTQGYGESSIGSWWSSSEHSSARVYNYSIFYMAPNLVEDYIEVESGLSVRCVRD